MDSREQRPLEFPSTVGVEVITTGLAVGDYGASHGEIQDPTIFERKSVADLFNSFTSNYEAERAKILKSAQLGLTYILAIEAHASDVLKGHSYWRNGKLHEHKKTGLAMLRQLMTIQRKYGLSIWFCAGRREMALLILEYFLSYERIQV